MNTHASPVAAINETRATVCANGAATRPLSESADLDAAARALAGGRTLHEVLGGLPARPAFAAAVRLAGVTSDADVSRVAAARFCADLASPGLRQIGVARASAGLWVIVTEPFASPFPDNRAQVQADILRAVNDARAHGRRCGSSLYGPTRPVRLSRALSDVALQHSNEMAASDVLQHEGVGGTDAAARVRRASLAARHVGENIASGVPTSQDVIAGWLASPGHCSVIMDPRFTAMGVSYALRPRSRGVMYWTQLFTEPP